MPRSNKRRRRNEIRDSINSDEDSGSDVGYMNTRESYSDDRGRLFSINVSPQKKSTKPSWATRRAWDPPEDLELGLDADPHVYDQAVEADVYEAPQSDSIHKAPVRKQRRTLRTVGHIYHCHSHKYLRDLS